MSELRKVAEHSPGQIGSAVGYEASVSLIVAHVHRLAEAARVRHPHEPTSAQFVRQVIAARAARRQFFAGDLFADPAWDIMLELYALECEQLRTSVSKLCIAAGVPATTALRWIDKLQSEGLITRSADPLDARRVWVSISTDGLQAMNSYLQELAPAHLSL